MKSSGHRGRIQGLTSDVEPLQLWLFCLKHERLRTRNKFEPQVREHCDHGPHSVNPSVELEESCKGAGEIVKEWKLELTMVVQKACK